AVLVVAAFALPHFIKPKAVEVAAPTAAPTAPPITDKQKAAIDANDAHWHDPLAPAPDKALLDEATGLPIISMNGREPWSLYARPYDRNDGRPQIVVVVVDLGQTQSISQSAIADLPGPVTLGFSNLSSELDAWMERARGAGHEVLLGIPMEPLEYPSNDPGPNTLLTHNSNDDNKKLLLTHLATAKSYIGITSLSGARMNTMQDKLRPILQELKTRGLLWFDADLAPLSASDAVVSEVKLPYVKGDLHIDEDMGNQSIKNVLDDAETNAIKSGHSVVVVRATPLSISMLRDWTMRLPSKHLSLAPLSSLAQP
ncbi:MAG: divergent polysaccharide deacetylase family protein, partial [Alphaproteobacteria bacterium]|nr:divergent polysaccharide deacetylase family protein [Alphaproteobacteria bacterium]